MIDRPHRRDPVRSRISRLLCQSRGKISAGVTDVSDHRRLIATNFDDLLNDRQTLFVCQKQPLTG